MTHTSNDKKKKHYVMIKNVKLLRRVSDKEIKIYDTDFTFTDPRQAGYNIGDLLNMPYLCDIWPTTTGTQTMYDVSQVCRNSVLDIYCHTKPKQEIVPNIPRIIGSVQTYLKKNQKNLSNILKLVRKKKCLCVHVRSGDLIVDDAYIKIIHKLSRKFKYVVLLSGIHLDQYFFDHATKIQNFLSTMNHILTLNKNVYLYLDKPDNHLCIMKVASHLLIHHGGYSALGSILVTGKLYITPEFHHANSENWKKHVNKSYILVQ